MPRFIPLSFAVGLLTCVCGSATAQQFADPEFDAKVIRPAFTDTHPLVLVDEAHNNFHTTFGRYKPFVDLLKNDGYNVSPNKEKLSAEALKDCSILVVANAMGAPAMRNPEAAKPAFEQAECDAVYKWIQAGGSLLLIADHHPFGASNDQLAKRLGVEMGKSTTYDPANAETGLPAQLNFTRVNHLLGDHPILSGRDGSERVDRVLTFAGQSLKGPKNAASLLKFSQTAVDQPAPAVPGRTGPASGRAQGIAFTLGKGNVVVLGEAGMLSAQVNRGGGRMGMNVPGTDNRQFALNAMHWLSHVKLSGKPAEIAAKPAKAGDSGAVASTSSAEAGSAGTARSSAMPARRTEPARPLSSAEIAAESEASIAMITGDGSVGTGFLVRPGILATNAHVIDSEFITTLRVRFPSAEKDQQGPMTAELLFEDTRRDLAFLKVKSSLPPLRVAQSYTFRKGEDITAIGNPGAGGELILENAISRGVMSTKTSMEGQRYYQLGIAVNPGNSGGPVFNSFGDVIGVVTRKSAMQEQLAFCIPVEDLTLALEKVLTFPQDAIDHQQSHHRLVLAVKELGAGGALYGVGIGMKRNQTSAKAKRKVFGGFYDAAIKRLEQQTFPRMKAEAARVRDDRLVSKATRDKVGQLADNLEKLRALYVGNTPPAPANNQLTQLRATHVRLLVDLCKGLDLEIPAELLLLLGNEPGPGTPDSP